MEKTLQKNIVKFAKASGMLAYKFESPSKRGVPDLLLINEHGQTMFLEIKHPNKKGQLSPLQRHEIQKLRAKGATVYVIDDYDRAKAIITAFSYYEGPARSNSEDVRV